MVSPVFTASAPKAKLAFAAAHPTKLDPHTSDVFAVIEFAEVALTSVVEGSLDRAAIRATPRAAYNLLVILARDFNLFTSSIKPVDERTCFEILHAAGITIAGNKEANATAFLDVFSSVAQFGIDGYNGSVAELALDAWNEELNSLEEPEDGDEDVEEQRAAWEVHSGSLRDIIERVEPFSTLYTLSGIYAFAISEGVCDTGVASVIAFFAAGIIESPVTFLNKISASITKTFKYPDACATLNLREVVGQTLQAITKRDLHPYGTIRKDLQLLTQEGRTVPKFLSVIRDWAPLADSIVLKSAAIDATVQLMARGREREECAHCFAPGHSKERCWKLLKEQGKPLPPEAKFYEQRWETRAKTQVHFAAGSKVASDHTVRRKALMGTLARPEADKLVEKLGVAVKDICDTMDAQADVLWTIERKATLRARIRDLVYDVATS
ncbi:hypothetical protein T484DRAFT_1868518 [Baffinella frigidus]|jgi:hypothetical protein|nr:hypothetical protein T484DRAFT_1868518 [Cryptophyta sp. CCMP2293]